MPDFLANLAVVLCVAAVTTVVFQRLRQPVVLGYLLAGMLIGPHIPVPLVADSQIVHTLCRAGRDPADVLAGDRVQPAQAAAGRPTAGFVAVVQCSLMMWLGYLIGQAFGWTWFEACSPAP